MSGASSENQESELFESFWWSGRGLGDAQLSSARSLVEVHSCYFQMTRACGLNPLEIMRARPCVDEQKHPVVLSRGCSKKYTELGAGQWM
jgi:hypothetical protein